MSVEPTTRFSYDDLLDTPEDGKRYEILDGELIVNAAPVPRHQRVVGRLFFALQSSFHAHGGGEVFGAPVDVVFEPYNVVAPDLTVILSDRANIVGE